MGVGRESYRTGGHRGLSGGKDTDRKKQRAVLVLYSVSSSSLVYRHIHVDDGSRTEATHVTPPVPSVIPPLWPLWPPCDAFHRSASSRTEATHVTPASGSSAKMSFKASSPLIPFGMVASSRTAEKGWPSAFARTY